MSNTIRRDTVKSYLLKEIQKGNLRIGKTINLAALSRKLDLSVTPIREALTQLEESNIVKAIPNRGFIIDTLSTKEAVDLYNTAAELEVLAVDTSVFDESLLNKLIKIQQELQQTHTAKIRLAISFKFHETLMEACENKVLTTVLRKLKSRIFFYEQLYITDASFYEVIDNQNEGIIRAIEENNLPTAALILKMNWMNSLNYLLKIMKSKTAI